jgi:hydrogenase maturation protease
VSAHGIGIREAVEIGRLLHRKLMPEKVMLVGIEGSCFDVIGGSMTPEVRSSLPEAAGEVLRLIDKAQSELRRA